MIAPFKCTGSAAYIGGTRRQSIKVSERGPCALQGFLRRARRIDNGPFERAEVVALLRPRNTGVGIGSVACARTDPGNSGVEVGSEEQSAERNVCGFRHRFDAG